jgi:hypothetical protein
MVRFAASLLVAALALLAGEAAYCQTTAPKAKNASPQLLLTIEDYLRLLPTGEVADRVREATKAPDALNSFRENWPTTTGNYHLNFEHKSAGVVLTCFLTVATTAQEAQRVADESFEGWITGASKNNKIQVSAIRGLDGLSKNGRFSVLRLDSGALYANLFVVNEGRNVVVIFLRGPMLLAEPASVERFLKPKLSKLTSFSPVF